MGSLCVRPHFLGSVGIFHWLLCKVVRNCAWISEWGRAGAAFRPPGSGTGFWVRSAFLVGWCAKVVRNCMSFGIETAPVFSYSYDSTRACGQPHSEVACGSGIRGDFGFVGVTAGLRGSCPITASIAAHGNGQQIRQGWAGFTLVVLLDQNLKLQRIGFVRRENPGALQLFQELLDRGALRGEGRLHLTPMGVGVGPPSHGGGRQSSFDRAERKIAQGREILQAVLLAIERHKRTPSATGKQGAVIVDGVRSRREDDIACLRRENQFIDADGRKAGGEVAGTKTEDTTTLTGPFARPEARAVNYVKNMANVDLG